MLVLAVLAAAAFVLWLFPGRRAKAARALRAQREASLAIVASERGMRLYEGDRPHAERVNEGSFSFQTFADACGFEYDAAVSFVATAQQAGPDFVVWPRDPPESVESFGSEIETGDATFDARFAVLTGAGEAVVAALDDPMRRHLLSLGTPALVFRSGTVWLLLQAMPQDELFEVAVSILAQVLDAVGRSGLPPYRAV